MSTMFVGSSNSKQKIEPSPIGTILATSAVLIAVTLANATTALSSPLGRTARSQVVNDESSLRLVGESGSELLEEGKVTGTLPGRARVLFNIGATVIAKVTLYPASGGSITCQGVGKLHSSGRYASFSGTAAITKGTGPYKHAHGTAGFYGTILRKSPYPVLVQTRGTLYY